MPRFCRICLILEYCRICLNLAESVSCQATSPHQPTKIWKATMSSHHANLSWSTPRNHATLPCRSTSVRIGRSLDTKMSRRVYHIYVQSSPPSLRCSISVLPTSRYISSTILEISIGRVATRKERVGNHMEVEGQYRTSSKCLRPSTGWVVADKKVVRERAIMVTRERAGHATWAFWIFLHPWMGAPWCFASQTLL